MLNSAFKAQGSSLQARTLLLLAMKSLCRPVSTALRPESLRLYGAVAEGKAMFKALKSKCLACGPS
jgi:hypothetical protein